VLVAAPPRRMRRERSGLGWMTLGAVFLVTGIAALLDNAGAISLNLAQFLALPLVVIAVGLLIGAWVGRARWLVVPGLLLVPAIVFASLVTVPFKGGFGDRLYEPLTATGASHPYRLIAGRMTLDLSQLPQGQTPRTVTASIVAGDMLVYVPPAVTVEVRAQVGAGQTRLFGRLSNGLKLDQRATQLRSGPAMHLVLAVSFGQITVLRR
jgi:hypothetical protein